MSENIKAKKFYAWVKKRSTFQGCENAYWEKREGLAGAAARDFEVDLGHRGNGVGLELFELELVNSAGLEGNRVADHCTVSYCSVMNGAVGYCTVSDCAVSDCAMGDSCRGNCTVGDCAVADCAVSYSTVGYCTVGYCAVMNGAVSDCAMSDSCRGNCTVGDRAVADCAVSYSTVSNTHCSMCDSYCAMCDSYCAMSDTRLVGSDRSGGNTCCCAVGNSHCAVGNSHRSNGGNGDGGLVVVMHVMVVRVLYGSHHILSLDGVHVYVDHGLHGALYLHVVRHGHGVRLLHVHWSGNLYGHGHVDAAVLRSGFFNDDSGVVGSGHVLGRLLVDFNFRVFDRHLRSGVLSLGPEDCRSLDSWGINLRFDDVSPGTGDVVLDTVLDAFLNCARNNCLSNTVSHHWD